ncbi:sensor histidine kinase [Paenibacillus barcinonensis]|uniref:histidine kinase n=1 Tax=Paenibacillus barcinonensis TaxID=198119 RepID=A0A2V4VZQ5_PAEBA|nr:ATP-binding protein [Paenibacillus barcinonensis]PYE44395.1 phospho-acceptor domain-containing protein [Paenibacillus barcinonensis]QKS58053.1 sensor histidine kinase [Paenibacillus barcinonensis]
MFNQTRRRLVMLNTVVFLIVLSVLSALLYAHMRFRLLHEIDEILQQAQKRVQSMHSVEALLQPALGAPEQDEQTTYLIWNHDQQLVGQSPPQSFTPGAIRYFQNRSDSKIPQTLSFEDHHYRVLQVNLPLVANSASRGEVTVTIVRSLEDVNHTLHSLLRDLVMGIFAGVLISLLAGLFLAGRALVPIRSSWDKQQRFVADASHELRTPTAIIRAETELLLQHPDSSIEDQSPHIAAILQESMRMSKLLDDLLTLARTDSNQLQIEHAQVEADIILVELAEQFQLLATTQDIQITMEIDEPLRLWGDHARIRQLFIIILDNALKYTPEGGQIRISGRIQSGQVDIRIADTGAGIAKEDLPHIFERFYRGDKARSRLEGGTGLGLSIARWIVDAHGGSIRVKSELAQGTEVQLRFPIHK